MSRRRLMRTGVTFAAAVFAIAGMSLAAASFFPDLDPIVNLAHLFGGAFLLAFLVAVIFWRRWPVLVLLAIAMAGPAFLVAPEITKKLARQTSSAAGSAPHLKIITANVWSLNYHYQALEDMITEERPDIVFLQETFKGWRDILAGMAPTYQIVAGCYWPHECNAVLLSRLEKAGESDPYDPSHVTARLRLPANLGGGVIEATSIHLSRPPPIDPQLSEVAQIEALAKTFGGLTVMGGDFNATPWSNTIRRLDQSLPLKRLSLLEPTWPAALPVAPVDHLYAGSGWRVIDVHVGPNIGSDHRPVIATLELANSSTPATATQPR